MSQGPGHDLAGAFLHSAMGQPVWPRWAKMHKFPCIALNARGHPPMIDILRLVHRVSEALGPGAAPDQVEAISRLVLEEATDRNTGNRRPARTSDRIRVIVTCVGGTNEELLSALTSDATNAGCDIVEVRSTRAGCSITCDLPRQGVSPRDLEIRLDAIAARLGSGAGVLEEALFFAINGSPPSS